MVEMGGGISKVSASDITDGSITLPKLVGAGKLLNLPANTGNIIAGWWDQTENTATLDTVNEQGGDTLALVEDADYLRLGMVTDGTGAQRHALLQWDLGTISEFFCAFAIRTNSASDRHEVMLGLGDSADTDNTNAHGFVLSLSQANNHATIQKMVAGAVTVLANDTTALSVDTWYEYLFHWKQGVHSTLYKNALSPSIKGMQAVLTTADTAPYNATDPEVFRIKAFNNIISSTYNPDVYLRGAWYG